MNEQDIKAGILKYPETTLEFANLVHVQRWAGLSRFAIQDDIQYLLLHFFSKQSHTFHDFEDVWNELQFSLIHYSCLYKEYRNVYLNTFYICALEYMHSPSDVYRSGAIFALYFLYHSQPQVWKKVPIRVDKDTWSRLFDFYAESIKHDKNIEAALIFDKLRSQNAFSFTAEQVFDPTSIQEREEFKDARLILDKLHALHIENIKNDTLAKCLDTDTYNAILSKYSDAKRKALATPQLTVVTQAMMKEKLRIRETKPARLRNFMTNTGMIDDTSISINLPKQSIVQSKIREMTTKQRQRKVQWEIKRTLAEEKLYNQRNDENEMVQVQGNESSDIMDDSLIG